MKKIGILILLTLIINVSFAQDASCDSIEFTIIKTIKTATPQTFLTGGSIADGKLTWDTGKVKPRQCTQQGIVFGIIYYKIKNNTSSDLKLDSDSLHLRVNEIEREVIGEFYIDENVSVFGGGGFGYTLKAGEEKTAKMIFTSTTQKLRNVTIEYENLIPSTRIKFE